MKKVILIVCFSVCASLPSFAQPGCTDGLANNYNAAAKTNNGSCAYNDIMLTPVIKYAMKSTLRETSGLLWWHDLVWTFNDSGGLPALYAVDSATGNITRTINITNASNIDWEDITQDDDYIYIGDFGNNVSGNRSDLKIYKIAKADVLASDNVTASVIHFSYSDQTDFTAAQGNHTNYDCEAFVAYGDSLFLFSKDWVDFHSRLYALPKTAGTYVATKKADINVNGLITGATILPTQKAIVLTGYTTILTPFLYLLYDFSNNDFFSGNKRRVTLNAAFTQVEGIAAVSNTYFLVSNEFFQRSVITTPARLQTIDLTSLLQPYYQVLALQQISLQAKANGNDVQLSWTLNPVEGISFIEIERKQHAETDFTVIKKLEVTDKSFIDIGVLPANAPIQYRLKITDKNQQVEHSKIVNVPKDKSHSITMAATTNQLKLLADETLNGTMEIISTNGGLIHKTPVAGLNPSVDISALPTGIYVARFSNQDYQQTAKFFKQ